MIEAKTKWVFVKFSNIAVVLDRQPLLGTGPLPDWLRNLAHSCAMVSLATFNERKTVKFYGISEKNTSDKLKNIMTLGIYDGHVFLIKDIEKLAKIYACVDCRVRLTKACHLQHHVKTCFQHT